MLPYVWKSLCAQTFRDFEWLVIDDGSTDNTASLVHDLAAKSDFPVRYVWQPNQHKKAAFNRAVSLANGELFLGVDSDDECKPDSLERFVHHWEKIDPAARADYCGVSTLCEDENGALIGDRFPCVEWMDSNYTEMTYRWNVKGEKWGFMRTEILHEYQFPDAEGYVPESYLWSQIASRYRTRYVNEILRIYYRDQPDSVVRQPLPQRTDGQTLGLAMELRHGAPYFCLNPSRAFYTAAMLVRMALHSRLPVPDLLREMWSTQPRKAKILLLAALPVGATAWLRDRCRARSAPTAQRLAQPCARSPVNDLPPARV